MRYVLALLLLGVLGAAWLWFLSNTDTPWWCEGWLRYGRGCEGWTFWGWHS